DLPRDLTLVEIDGREEPIRRFEERQALHKRSTATAFAATRRGSSGCAGRGWCSWSGAPPGFLREISGAAETRPLAHTERLAGPAQHVFDIRESFGRLDQPDRRDAGI